MKTTTKLLAGAVAVVIGGLAMTSIASATATVTPLAGETVNYTLNGNENFSAGVLQIDDGETKIFILDRNLGATTAGTGCEDPDGSVACPANDPTYGYHFQWGNNYGFDPNSTPTIRTTQVESSSLIYDPLHQQYYSSSQFFIDENDEYWNWLDDNSVVDLWGGSVEDNTYNVNDDTWQVTNQKDRQGPCPEGFHVPSRGELDKIKTMMGDDASEIHNKLLIPFASYRLYNAAEVYPVADYARLWSSSPRSAERPDSRYLNLGVDGAMEVDQDYRANAFSVRCIYDSYQTYTKASDLSGEIVAQITLNVVKGNLTIGTTTGNLNLGEVNVSNSAQELSGSFGENSFWVEDMKGLETGYYTTISVTDLTGTVPTHVISANNVSLKTAGNEPSYISGAIVSDSKVVFSNDIKFWHNNWAEPVTYFNRQNTATADAGRVGKWGDNLQIKVNIPAHTPSDTYKGTITYTLYDLDS